MPSTGVTSEDNEGVTGSGIVFFRPIENAAGLIPLHVRSLEYIHDDGPDTK